MAEAEGVQFDLPTANRVLKATRIVEGMSMTPASGRREIVYSIEQIVVPRSGPDGDGFYTVDIYIVNNPLTGTYTQVATGQKARLLPASL